MAFLCPVWIRKAKKKDQQHITLPGRITGSASLDTLIQVDLAKKGGLSPDSCMNVLQDFVPYVDDELMVKKGDTVYALYRDYNWLYVLREDGQEGFVPMSYARPANHKGSSGNGSDDNDASLMMHKCANDHLIQAEENPIHYQEAIFFPKANHGKYFSLFNFEARDENDVSVASGEIVTILNKDDPQWFWVKKTNQAEGFVPSPFLVPEMMISRKN